MRQDAHDQGKARKHGCIVVLPHQQVDARARRSSAERVAMPNHSVVMADDDAVNWTWSAAGEVRFNRH
jgi:hypothetical protein